jgi:hypothetical protein
VDPLHLLVDLCKSTAGGIVVLAEMLLEHPLAEPGIVPGDVVSLSPGKRGTGAVEEIKKVHVQ